VLSVDGPRRAVIAGGSETLRIGDAASYLVFDGLELRNSTNNVIHIDGGSHHIWLRNVYAHHAGVGRRRAEGQPGAEHLPGALGVRLPGGPHG
jgi:hypothetical protein